MRPGLSFRLSFSVIALCASPNSGRFLTINKFPIAGRSSALRSSTLLWTILFGEVRRRMSHIVNNSVTSTVKVAMDNSLLLAFSPQTA